MCVNAVMVEAYTSIVWHQCSLVFVIVYGIESSFAKLVTVRLKFNE